MMEKVCSAGSRCYRRPKQTVPKGRNVIAQGNALGTGVVYMLSALKGRHER
jgi:hypothetical protein